MGVSFDDIKMLREATSCGVIDCKKALEEAGGDVDQAKKILQQRGLELAAKKSTRLAKEGRVETYIHMGNKLGVLVEVNSETDFVARNPDFVQFCKDVAMHIAAMNPAYISEKDVPADMLEKEQDKEAFLKERCLMNQEFVKDSSKTIQEYLNSLIAKIGENMFVSRFVRFKVGEVE